MKRKWTQEELDYLIESYNSLDIKVKEIAQALNRGQDSVVKKAKSLGLKKFKVSDIPVPEGHKVCRNCRKIKPLDEFHRRKNNSIDGRDFICRTCSSLKTKERRNQKILEKIKKQIEEIDNNKIKEKEDFLIMSEGKLFKCNTCKRELPANAFSIIKKYDKVRVNFSCKECSSKRTEEYTLRSLRTKGHR